PWVVYRTRLDLLGQDVRDAAVRAARAAMTGDARIRAMIAELGTWPEMVLASHKSAGQPFHRLNFLADLGLRATDPGMDAVIANILAHQAEEGPFQLPMKIRLAHEGGETVTWAWALCDAPLLVRALACFGLGEDPRVRAAARYLGVGAGLRIPLCSEQGAWLVQGARPQE
ncbi:MAG: hypothetical protein N3A02_00060, partial [Rectinema sp.]|nr:hypothetical protein [Rectinema sp.]